MNIFRLQYQISHSTQKYWTEVRNCMHDLRSFLIYNQFYLIFESIIYMQRLTASSADHFFSKSTEDERHVEGDLISTNAVKSKFNHHYHKTDIHSLSFRSCFQKHCTERRPLNIWFDHHMRTDNSLHASKWKVASCQWCKNASKWPMHWLECSIHLTSLSILNFGVEEEFPLERTHIK